MEIHRMNSESLSMVSLGGGREGPSLAVSFTLRSTLPSLFAPCEVAWPAGLFGCWLTESFLQVSDRKGRRTPGGYRV